MRRFLLIEITLLLIVCVNAPFLVMEHRLLTEFGVMLIVLDMAGDRPMPWYVVNDLDLNSALWNGVTGAHIAANLALVLAIAVYRRRRGQDSADGQALAAAESTSGSVGSSDPI